MKNCPHCHKSIEDALTVCSFCQGAITEIVPAKKYTPIFSLKELLSLLGIGISLGMTHNYLFYQLDAGISVPLFTSLFLLSIFIISRISQIIINRNMIVVGVTIFVFSLFQAIRVSDILTSLNTIALYFSSLLLLLLLVKQRFEDIRMDNYMKGFGKIILGSIGGLGIWLKNLVGLGIKIGDTDQKIHILKGILMAIPLIFVFTLLFSSADLVFQKFVGDLLNFNLLDILQASERLINIIFFSVVFVGIFTFVSYNIRTFQKKEEDVEIVIDDKKHIEIYVMLGLVSLLFLTFIVIQISYLFGGEQMILSQGHTYAEYATKGFQELAAIAFIVFVLFWQIDQYLYAHKKPSNSRIYKGLSSLIISLTLIILLSAFQRLWLYETMYGFTEIRFYGYICIVMLGLASLIILHKILFFMKEGHFLISIISLCGIALLVCNVINPESFITESNTTKNYRGSLKMDSYYISNRSEDAVDNMIKTYATLDGVAKKDMEVPFCRMLGKLKKEYSWQEFNYSRYHAQKVLSMREGDLNCTIKNIHTSR
ncbi:MAG: DUF4173 domain-containing protein [Candidatus Gracilibacteria bacterium]